MAHDLLYQNAFGRSINKASAKPCLSRYNLPLTINDNKALCTESFFVSI